MKIFAAAKHLLGTRVPFRKFKIPFHSCEPTCEILKAKFRKSTIQLAKIFTTYETPPSHTCAISQLQNPISQLRIKLRTNLQNGPTCEITSNLRKYQPSFKFLFKPLILSFFILYSTPTCKKTLQVAKLKNFRRSPPKKA